MYPFIPFNHVEITNSVFTYNTRSKAVTNRDRCRTNTKNDPPCLDNCKTITEETLCLVN